MVAPDVAKFDDSTQNDASLMNLIGVIRNTGTYLSGLTWSQHTLVVANDTSGGFVKDHLYLLAQDGVTKIDVSGILAHIHNGGSNGGGLIKILAGNPHVQILDLTKTQDLLRTNWVQTTSGTGTIEDGTGDSEGERYIRLRPNGTSGSAASITYPYLLADWASRLTFVAKLKLETASNLALHTGIAPDLITSADSNNRKAQAEVCTVTNNNWWLRTADGAGNSASDTAIAITNTAIGIKIQHYGDIGTPETDLKVGGGTILQKTSNVPDDAESTYPNIVRHSIKNSTGADRPMKVFGTKITLESVDDWGYPGDEIT